jgi:hypothetical protein
MKNLREHITNLDQSDWDYYFPLENNYIPTPFSGHITHENFIKRYFKRGGKDRIFKNYFSITSSLLNHSEHTNSIFFLGILISKKIKLNNQIFNHNNLPGYSLFPFLWFLTCLFHDLGYDYEETKEYKDRIWDIDSLKKELRIKNDFLSKTIHGVPNTIVKNITKYFIWKRFVKNSLDHGIVAGYYLYDKLVKNRKYRYKKNNDKLFWHPDLDQQYAEVAAIIASHNIWFANQESKESYETFEMNELIGHSSVNISDFPLLFLLGLVDSIDPIKIFKDKPNKEEIIKNLQIRFSDNSLSFAKNSIESDDFNTLKKKCEDLKLWLDVQILVEQNRITIKINE